MSLGDPCDVCGHAIAFACGWHCSERYVYSHRCHRTGRTTVECQACGKRATGGSTDEAVAMIGGRRDAPP